RHIRRVLKPGGVLILTTPNAANLMNATRLMLGHPFMRGTQSFAETTKFSSAITTDPRVHYREYTPRELRDLLEQAGFTVRLHQFMPVGASSKQHALKRVAKKAIGPLLHQRPFGATQFVLASADQAQ
ncbi:MAG: methyltransferase domain-containing protein, partial [Acidiferrobacterales bacterium]|nr:methyltransferase domain-containing protein [Acidiferrobacterales bacterium]